MKVIFHTNLDPKYSAWYFPEKVCCRPQIGDLVAPVNGDQVLKVSSITHCEDSKKEPYLQIGLIKQFN